MSDRCWYCGCELVEPSVEIMQSGDIRRMRVREHQLPKSRGGTETVPSCFSCNSKKGTKTLDEYRFYVQSKNPVIKAAYALRDLSEYHWPYILESLLNEADALADRLEQSVPRVVFFGEQTRVEVAYESEVGQGP